MAKPVSVTSRRGPVRSVRARTGPFEWGASDVVPKFIWPNDSLAQWTGARRGRHSSCSDNYPIDLRSVGRPWRYHSISAGLSGCWRGRQVYRAAGALRTTSLQRVTSCNTPRVPFELR
jgi:hypothetical protein